MAKKSLSKLVSNESATVTAEKIANHKVTVNITKNLIRTETMEGREYIVVPMVMMVEGVLNGGQGALLYTAEELEKIPAVWNHKPVVVYHPEINGQGVSACSPEIITSHKIGVIMNAITIKEEGKIKLKAEAWLEPSRIEVVDNRIAEAIASETMLELSTGLFVDVVDNAGDFNGEQYTGIATNFRPDHLAILPDQIGACSRGDGAGFIRNNLGIDFEIPKHVLAVIQSKAFEMAAPYITNAKHRLSNSNLEHQLFHLLEDELGSVVDFNSDNFMPFWIVDVFAVEEFVIYEFDGKFFKFDYNVENEVVSLTGERVEVVRVTEFRTVDGAFVGNKTTNKKITITMKTKKEIVDALIANHGWDASEREYLTEQTVERLKKMLPTDNVREPSVEEIQVAADKKIADDKEAELAANKAAEEAEKNNEPKELTVDEYIAKAPSGMRDVLESSLATHNAQKTELVEAIVANSKNTFTADQLNAKSLPELQSIAKLAAVEVKTPVANYQGAGNPHEAPVENTETPLETPVISFEKTG